MTKLKLPRLLFYTTGLPGAGKTQFCTKLKESSNVEHVSTDRISFDLFGHPGILTPSERQLIIKEAEYKMEDLLGENKPVIYDATVGTEEWRNELKQFAAKLKVTLVPIYFKTPVDIAKQRALTPRFGLTTKTWRVLTPKQFEKKLSEYEQPDTSEYLVISGTDNFDKQLKCLLDFVDSANH